MSKKDDVDKFLKKTANRSTYDQYKGRRSDEIKMWEKWKAGGKQQADLEPLLRSLDPLITRKAKERAAGVGGRIPFAAIKQEHIKSVIKSLENYDPTRGVPLTSHVTTGFMRVTDFIEQNRNTVYMPRSMMRQYQQLQNANNEFMEQHGREPTTEELAGELYGSKPAADRTKAKRLKDIESMRRGFAPEVFTGVGGGLKHDTGYEPDIYRSAFLMQRTRMTAEQRRFGELHYPPEGQRQKTVKEIAREMGVSEQRVYALKAKVEGILRPTIRKS